MKLSITKILKLLKDLLRIRSRNKIDNVHVKASPDIYRNYETLVLNQPHLEIRDIYKYRGWYYIECSNYYDNIKAIDGQLLLNWFRDHSTIGSRTIICKTPPPGSERVIPMTIDNQASLETSPRNQTFLYNDLLSLLPKNFPKFKVSDENTGRAIINTEKELTTDDKQIVISCLQKLNEIELKVEFRATPLNEVKTSLIDDVLLLINSNAVHYKIDSKLKPILEEDEDFWATEKLTLANQLVNKRKLLPSNWHTNESSCFVSQTFRPGNIRNYLTLYNRVYLLMPISECHDEYFKHLGCTEDELILLCSMNRVKLILDQPIHRYDKRLHNIILTISQDDFLQTRRLAALSVVDLRTRLPFAFPTIDIQEKHKILFELHSLFKKNNIDDGMGQNILRMLGLMWENYIDSIERLGAFGLHHYGFNQLSNLIFKKENTDRSLFLLEAEPGVNYAAALGANLITDNQVNKEVYSQFIANMYSGMPKDFIPGKQHESNIVLEDILLVNGDVPLLELSETFKSSDIDRLRGLIYSLTKHNGSEEQLKFDIGFFNNEVRHFVKRKEQMSAMDLKGFILDTGLSGLNSNIPFLGWFLGLTIRALSELGAKKKTINLITDYLESQMAGTIPDAVLVARMRDAYIQTSKNSKYGY